MKKDLFKSCIAFILAAGIAIGSASNSLLILTASAEEPEDTEIVTPTEVTTPETQPTETSEPSEPTEEITEPTTPKDIVIERIAVKKLPDKVEYVIGQSFDISGIVIQAYFSDGSVTNIDSYTYSSPDMTTIGKKVVTVYYKSWTAEFSITVVNRAVQEYQYTPPTKTEYFQNEPFDITGLSLTIIYNDGVTETPEVSFEAPDMSILGEQRIRFRWGDHSEWFIFNVSLKNLTNLTLSGTYKKTYAYGEELDLTGLVVTANYDNAAPEVVTDYTVSGYDGFTPGEQELTVSYGGIKTILVVTVKEKPPYTCPGDDACPSREYNDVNKSLWYHEGIDYVISQEIMVGVSPTKFAPEQVTTRGMIVTILWRLAGSPSVKGSSEFKDVKNGAWYCNAVIWANQNGIVSGYGNGKFGPNDIITREQLAAMLYRYAQFQGMDTSTRADLSSLPDMGKISGWAKEAMEWTYAEGMIVGIPQTNKVTQIQPKGNATRAQAAAVLYRFCQSFVD